MAMADGPRTAPGYVSSTDMYGSMSADALETVADLTWPSNVSTYAKMRRDPQIAATLNAYMLPIRAAKWAVNPEGCRTEVVQYVADQWGLPVLGKDTKKAGFRRRGVIFKEHLRAALLHLVYGHSPFAYAGEITGDPTRWSVTTIAERPPQTISQIEVNDDGTLSGIYQYGEDRLIPAQNLIWYVHDKEGSNWAGTSMLREAYGPWLLKHDMWRVLGIASRRFGMGVPYVEAPPGATESEIQAAARFAEAMRVGDQSGAGVPSGFKPHLMGMTGSSPDTLGFVRYLDSQIAQGVLASVLNLPDSGTGNRALGETLLGLLKLSWSAVADEIAIPASQATARWVDINWGEKEPSPEIVCVGLGAPEPTAEAINQFIASGAITADPGLEEWVRGRYELPDLLPGFEKKPGKLPADIEGTPNPNPQPNPNPTPKPRADPKPNPQPNPQPSGSR
jgi:hypothetical protein